MAKLKTFPKGGVHPEENKLSEGKSIEVFPIPDMVSVMITQHLGAPSSVLVKKGDTVKVGTPIASSSGFISANLHSPVSGQVQKVEDVLDASGYKKPAVIIKVEGDEWEASIDRSPELITEISLTPEEIITRVKDCGIVGLGGATFPSHVKLMVPKGKKVDLLVINGVECEPYLTSDHRLMLERGEEILVGVTIIMKALNVGKAVIGIEDNKRDAIEYLSLLAKKFKGIDIQALKLKYPQGAEKQLIKAVTKREVPPPPALPIDVGAVVQNVGTALAVYEAVQKNKPLVDRVVTITGKSITNPANFLVRIGTPISALIGKAGGLPEDTGKVISGGPMMGKALIDLNVPVVKGTSGILVLPQSISAREKEGPCIRCGRCISACVLGVEPYLLAALVKKKLWEHAEREHVMDCCECGSCHYCCPSKIPLLDYLRVGKSEVGKIIRSRKK